MPRTPSSVQDSIEDTLPPDLSCPISYKELNNVVYGNDGRLYDHDTATRLVGSRSPFNREIKFSYHEHKPFKEQMRSIIKTYKEQVSEIESLKKQIETLKQEKKALELKSLKPEIASEDKKTSLFTSGPFMRSFYHSKFIAAVKKGDLAQTSYYLRQGVSVNFQDHDSKETALLIALRLRKVKPLEAQNIIRLLCEDNQIDLTIRDTLGFCAIDVASFYRDEWAVSFLKNLAKPSERKEFK